MAVFSSRVPTHVGMPGCEAATGSTNDSSRQDAVFQDHSPVKRVTTQSLARPVAINMTPGHQRYLNAERNLLLSANEEGGIAGQIEHQTHETPQWISGKG